MYYITYVFTMAGLADSNGKMLINPVFPPLLIPLGGNAVLLPSGIQFVSNVVMTVPALLWMDHWGRRPTLLVGAFLMCLWLSVNAGLFATYSRPARPGEFPSKSESMAISGPAAKAV